MHLVGTERREERRIAASSASRSLVSKPTREPCDHQIQTVLITVIIMIIMMIIIIVIVRVIVIIIINRESEERRVKRERREKKNRKSHVHNAQISDLIRK